MDRIHQIAQPMAVVRITDKLFHKFQFRQAQAFDRVRGEETILNIEERCLRFFGDAPRHQRQIGRLLNVACEQHAPATIGHPHHVVVTGMNVQALRSERPRADVKNHRQALAGDDVKNFLHQDQALPRSEVRHPPACQGKSFTGTRRTMLRFQFKKSQWFVPEIFLAVGDSQLIATAHVCRRCDRIGARTLGNVSLDPNHRL